jgi:hypothetical protein
MIPCKHVPFGGPSLYRFFWCGSYSIHSKRGPRSSTPPRPSGFEKNQKVMKVSNINIAAELVQHAQNIHILMRWYFIILC